MVYDSLLVATTAEDQVAWTEITRRHHDRNVLRYARDRTDAEWEIIAPFLARGGTVGRPSIHGMRAIWEGIQYQATSGCQWRMLPKDLPPFTAIHHHEGLAIEIVKRSDRAGFVVLPKRWGGRRDLRLVNCWRGLAAHLVHPPYRQNCRSSLKRQGHNYESDF